MRSGIVPRGLRGRWFKRLDTCINCSGTTRDYIHSYSAQAEGTRRRRGRSSGGATVSSLSPPKKKIDWNKYRLPFQLAPRTEKSSVIERTEKYQNEKKLKMWRKCKFWVAFFKGTAASRKWKWYCHFFLQIQASTEGLFILKFANFLFQRNTSNMR